MSQVDDGDIIKAVGFACIYSAYLEEKLLFLINLLKQSFNLPDKISDYSMKDQAKYLIKAFKKYFKDNPDYFSEDTKELISQTLKGIEKISVERNRIIHSVLYSNTLGIITQTSHRERSIQEIISKEVYELANYIDGLRENVERIHIRLHISR